MENIIVEIELVSAGRTEDFMLPAHVPVSQLLPHLISLVEQVDRHIAYEQGTPILVSLNTGKPLALNRTLAQNGLRDGHRMMLV